MKIQSIWHWVGSGIIFSLLIMLATVLVQQHQSLPEGWVTFYSAYLVANVVILLALAIGVFMRSSICSILAAAYVPTGLIVNQLAFNHFSWFGVAASIALCFIFVKSFFATLAFNEHQRA